MDRIELPSEAWSAPQTSLERDLARHLVKSLRARAGDRFEAVDGEGREGTFEIVEASRSGTLVRRIEERITPPGVGARVTIAVAPPKGDRMDVAIEKACEIGVGCIIPIVAARSVVKIAADSARVERWRRIARAAMVQSMQSHAAHIEAPVPFESVVAAASGGSGTASPRLLLAHPAADARSMHEAFAGLASATPVTIVIGPEGGFSDDEAAFARGAGAAFVSLGDTRLRTETAAVVAAALALEELRAARDLST